MKLPNSILVSAIFVAGFAISNPSSHPDEAKTREVVSHHWQTFQGNDLEGTLADYTENSVLITPNRTYKGMNDIRDNFVSAFVRYPKGTATKKLDKMVIERDIGYIIWEATGPTVRLVFGTDTFVVRDGKIISQTFGGVDGQP